ncbi:hypothetical protein [Liberibacter crescens]|nr:hypothetical protein [Liberibacter crescens]
MVSLFPVRLKMVLAIPVHWQEWLAVAVTVPIIFAEFCSDRSGMPDY